MSVESTFLHAVWLWKVWIVTKPHHVVTQDGSRSFWRAHPTRAHTHTHTHTHHPHTHTHPHTSTPPHPHPHPHTHTPTHPRTHAPTPALRRPARAHARTHLPTFLPPWHVHTAYRVKCVKYPFRVKSCARASSSQLYLRASSSQLALRKRRERQREMCVCVCVCVCFFDHVNDSARLCMHSLSFSLARANDSSRHAS